MEALRGLAWLLVLQLADEVLARAFSLPLPGPVIGMLLLMPALGWRPLREPVAGVARFLLAHLSLLFVPVGVGVITHLGVLQQYGLKLMAVIAVSTWVGLAVSALALRALMPARAADTADAPVAEPPDA
ncbi:CidA/LrgA family protein [Ottowia testudinis]|uniref:CidA/LrgA family protein n=1 Tax=Ottowia testudinis TaxID=2816950 RepID=A0A975CJW9_9BURK|nr:CidA/LrgA family protein [Ottowia testudinis]QTD45539.1 CidA/LrgA family protein [Ottowia testudinis]